ncbi:hypothetical protein RHMOL_Rhmol11G0102800 [Rhododendron molle]|uniref:Uncharacterized protein n=1 Tax=Rhododendron molle TaxID=49168 RepID=A0ACC0LRG9_RHOML|nr:hypothetical protein RHMOL_Rhmol11G0102800 [Rhododendron molle]
MGRKTVAQKRAPMEEEDEQLTHHEQEQESHNQEPAKQTPACESSEDEEEEEDDDEELEVEEEQKVEKNKASVQKPITPIKPQHPPSSDSDSGSDSEAHVGSPTASGFTIKPVSPQPKKPTSGKRLVPEFERKANESSRKKKKAKVFEEEAEKKKSGVGVIHRLWSEEDEVVILEGLMDFKSPDMGGLYEVIKKSLSFDASKSQFVDKIHKLKRKYSNNVERGDKAVLSRPHERKCFELSKKIWGGGKENNNGGDGNGKNVGKKAGKTVKRDDAVALPEENDGKESALGEENKNGVDGNGKSNGTKKARKKTVKLNDVALPREESGEGEVALGEGSKGGEMKDMKAGKVGDFWATHPCLKQSLAVKEPVKSFMMENMSMIGDVKAKELEKKWKDFYVDEVGLYLKRVQLVKEQTKLVLGTMKASKD